MSSSLKVDTDEALAGIFTRHDEGIDMLLTHQLAQSREPAGRVDRLRRWAAHRGCI